MSGCAHNGILNIVDTYKELFGDYPDIVISGFHMIQKDEYTKEDIDNIKETAEGLLKTGAIYFSGHCTGAFAYGIMKEIMGEKLQSIHSGKGLSERSKYMGCSREDYEKYGMFETNREIIRIMTQ